MLSKILRISGGKVMEMEKQKLLGILKVSERGLIRNGMTMLRKTIFRDVVTFKQFHVHEFLIE